MPLRSSHPAALPSGQLCHAGEQPPFLACWRARPGRAQCQGSGPNSLPVNNGLERQVEGGEAEGEGLASFHRRRMSLDLPLGHSLGKGCPGRSRREARAAQRKAPTEILFPGRVRPHCQPHPAGLGTEEEREANLRSLKAAHSSVFALCPFFPGVAFAASAPAGSIATWQQQFLFIFLACMHE